MAQYYSAFAGDTVGNPPSGFTDRWHTGGSRSWNIENDPGGVNGNVVSYHSTWNVNRLLSFDAVSSDPSPDVELLVRLYPSETPYFAGLVACRASGSDDDLTGYALSINNRDTLCIHRFKNSGWYDGVAHSVTIPVVPTGQRLFVRFRVNGSTVSAKLWSSGFSEPSMWTSVWTDPDPLTNAGWAGFYGKYVVNRAYYDLISVATNGDTAILPDTVPSSARIDSAQATLKVAAQPGDDLQTSQVRLIAAGSYPTEFITAPQLTLKAAVDVVKDLEVSQVRVMAAARGRVDNPKLKAWSYVLDGHSYYVLRLGNGKSLVYDLSTEQWSWFATTDREYWEVASGFNWKSAGKNPFDYGSNILVGHDSAGYLYFLNPQQGVDDSGLSHGRNQKTFIREATAQVISRERSTIPCFQVYLTGSVGDPESISNAVTLLYSDDRGHTYRDAGSYQLSSTDWTAELAWRSLGLIKQPGRLFKIRDGGALARIDGLDMSLGAS